MATKKTNNTVSSDFDLDQILDMDSKFDFGAPSIKDDRKPIVRAAVAAAKGAVKAPRNSAFLKRTLKDALPRGYGQTIEQIEQATSSVRNLYDESVKVIKPALRESKRVASKVIPRESKILPKYVTNLGKKWDEEARREARTSTGLGHQDRESMFNQQMADIFKAQQQIETDRTAEQQGRDRLKEGIEMTRHREISETLFRTAVSIDKIQKYQSTVTLGYQKKSLELQYRTLFVLQDQLTQMKESGQARDALLMAIAKNTTLPDAVKINSKEAREAIGRNKFNESVHKGLFGGRDQLVENTLGRVSNMILGHVRGLAGGAMSAANMVDQGQQASEMGRQAGMDPYAETGEMIGSFLGEQGGAWALRRGKKALNSGKFDRFGAKKFLSGSSKLENLYENRHNKLNAFRKSNKYTFDDTMKGGFLRFMQSVVPNVMPDMSVRGANNKDMDAPASLTRKTMLSVDQVIPGYLARILRTLQVSQTGNNNIELTTYNYAQGKFMSKGKAESAMLKEIINGKAAQRTNDQLDRLLKEIDPSGKSLSPQAQAALRKKLLMNSANMNEANRDNLAKYGAFHDVDDKTASEIVPLMSKFFDSMSDEKRTEFSRANNSLAKSIADPREAIQRQADWGNMGWLKKAGLVDPQGKNIDMSRIVDYILDPKNSEAVQKMQGEDRSAGNAFQSMARTLSPKESAKDKILNGLNSAKGAFTQGASAFGSMTPQQMASAAKNYSVNIGGRLQTLAADVYVKGETSPRIIAAKMKMGAYRDRATQKIITSLADIRGEVEDVTDNSIVLQSKDMLRLTYVAPDTKVLEDLKPADAAPQSSSILGQMTRPSMLVANLKKKAVDSVMSAQQPGDVYVEGESEPRMTAAKMAAGAYSDVDTGKPIRHQSEINGDVQDETGAIVVSKRELPKLRVWDHVKRVFAAIRYTGALALKLAKGFWAWEMKMWQISKWNFRMIGKGLKAALAVGRGAVATGKAILGIESKKARDVYVKGESQPRMYAARMIAGDYRDLESGERIHHHSQITGPVIDRDEQIVIAAEDMDKLQTYDSILRILNPIRLGTKALKWASGMLWKGVKGFQTKVAPAISKFLLRGLGAGVKMAAHAVSRALDVYVKGERTARLSAALMKAGQYIDVKTKKIIAVVADITGPVMDLAGNILVGEDEFGRGLVRVDGTPLRGGLLGGAKRGMSAINKLLSVRVKLPAGQRAASTDSLLKNKAATTGDKTVALLEDIRDIFQSKFGKKSVLGDRDGDGMRDGSWQDIFSRKKKDAEGGALDPKKVGEKAAGGGLLGGLAKLLGLGKKKEGEEGGSSGWGWKEAAGLGGGMAGAKAIWSARLGKMLRFGKGVGPGIVAAAGGAGADYLAGKAGVGGNNIDRKQDDTNWNQMSALEKLESGASRGIEKVGQFAFMGNMANEAGSKRIGAETEYLQQRARGEIGKGVLDYLLGGAAMKGVNAVGGLFGMQSAKISAYDNIRYTQYGFDEKNTTMREASSKTEDLLMPFVKDGISITIDESKINAKEIMSLWDLDPKKNEHVQLFFKWYKNRFKPVFLVHLNAVKRFAGKMDLRAVGSIKKEDAAAYIQAIAMPGGPYDFKEIPTLVPTTRATTSYAVEAAVAKALKDTGADKAKKAVEEGKGGAAAAAVAGATAAVGADGKPVDASKMTLSGMDTQTKLPALAVAGTSTYGKDSFTQDKRISAFDSVRMKVYGLQDADTMKVVALKMTESYVKDKVKYGGDGKATWDGNAMDVLAKVQGAFGIGNIISAEARGWLAWFKNRFLPTFLAYCSSYRNLTGKVDLNGELLKMEQQLQIAKMLVGISGIWGQSDSPWPRYTLSSSDEVVQDNIRFMEQATKALKLQEQKANPTKTEDASAKPSLWERTKSSVSSFFSSDKKSDQNKLPDVTSPDAEAPVKSVANGVSPVSVGGGNSTPTGSQVMAGGELADGRNGMAYLQLGNNVKLDGMHPAFMKNFLGMAEEYGKLTGKKIGINDAFRSFEAQQAMKKKYGPRAAAPGSSLHEYGLAMDIDTKVLDEMDKMGLMRKYGFTRPVGGEGWHMEPIGIQQDIAKFKKDQAAAQAAIDAGVGKGGGGFGTVAGAPKYSRNRELALSIMTSPSQGAPATKPADPYAVASGNVGAPQVPAGGTGLGVKSGGSLGGGMAGNGAAASPNMASAAVADGEVKPQGGNFTNTVMPQGASGLGQRTPSMPADPSVKVPDPSGSGYSGMKDTIEAAAKMVGVDADTMVRMAAIESSFNPSAKAGTSSASGLFQFTRDTWRAMIAKYGQKYGYTVNTPPTDPKAASIMAAHMLKDSQKFVGSKISRPFGATEAYMTHFLGMGGAVNFLQALEKNPQASAAEIMPKAAAANQGIFFENGRPRSLQEVYAHLDNKVNNKLTGFGIPAPTKGAAYAAQAATSSGSQDATGKVVTDASAATAPAAAPGMQQTSYSPSADTGGKKAAPLPGMGGDAGPSGVMGFKPPQDAQRVAPSGQPAQLDPAVFTATKDVLTESLSVQKQSLAVLQQMAEIMRGNGGATGPKDNMPNAAPKGAPEAKDQLKVPQGTVKMSRMT